MTEIHPAEGCVLRALFHKTSSGLKLSHCTGNSLNQISAMDALIEMGALLEDTDMSVSTDRKDGYYMVRFYSATTEILFEFQEHRR